MIKEKKKKAKKRKTYEANFLPLKKPLFSIR